MAFLDEPLVRETSERFRILAERSAPELEKKPLRAMRNALILNGYVSGYTLQEVAEPFGLTRERARQVIKRLVGARNVKGLPTRHRRSEGAKREARERGLRQRASGERQRNADRNLQIEELVKAKLSYAEVARRVGVTRSIVCTVMYRAKHRTDVYSEGRKYPLLRGRRTTV